ncbi:MAG: hypothetical protein Q8K12_13355 [Thiobacillus sp.]|nr:hypothetical protein [Thiobacillus sp.]
MNTVTVVRKDGRIAIAADTLARLGVMAAAEFHDESGLPVQSFVMDEE